MNFDGCNEPENMNEYVKAHQEQFHQAECALYRVNATIDCFKPLYGNLTLMNICSVYRQRVGLYEKRTLWPSRRWRLQRVETI